MSSSNLMLANNARLATEERSRDDGASSYVEHYQHVLATPIGALPLPMSRYLAAAGSADMAVDGSSTAVEFELVPASAEIVRVARLALVIGTSAAPTMTAFGTI